MTKPTIDELQSRLRDFAKAREWEQFHNPKDLAISIAIESAEVLEVFQWKSPNDITELLATHDGQAALADELADVLIYLLRLADVTGIDLATAAADKIKRNETRFPTTGR